MNKLASEIPNRIKQPAMCCVYCGKSYVKRPNLNKHMIICELLQRSKRAKRVEDDEPDIPSQQRLFQMLIELGEKYSMHTNMGYGTKAHFEGIRKHGITEWHRKSYKGVQ